jgi:DNA repair ATPase RecN
MFTDDIERLEQAIRELKDVRKQAQADGQPLEEIHRRLLHLQQAVKLARLAPEEFLKALSPGLTDEDGEDVT